jgi:hypothetical protein
MHPRRHHAQSIEEASKQLKVQSIILLVGLIFKGG